MGASYHLGQKEDPDSWEPVVMQGKQWVSARSDTCARRMIEILLVCAKALGCPQINYSQNKKLQKMSEEQVQRHFHWRKSDI